MNSIYNLTKKELEDYFEQHGSKKFHGRQVFEWLYQKKVKSFEEMTNLKKEMIDELNKEYSINSMNVIDIKRDKDVSKFLFELSDDEHIEAVLMYHDYGRSLCISSQVGCNMACSFCESGRRKRVRNLSTGEMVEQILLIEELEEIKISHVVVMGIGEPFDNYDNLIKFIEIVNDTKGLMIGSRHITVSTCGLIPKIKEFMKIPYQVNLAISLHASNDELRNKLMPVNKAYPLKDLMNVLKEYTEYTNRRITFEYIMLENINDQESDALALAKRIQGLNCYVNLIPYNETSHIEFKRSKKLQILKFYDILKKNKVNVTIRREFGKDISAACGQLRSEKEDV